MKKNRGNEEVARTIAMKIGWQLGNLEIALKCHDEVLELSTRRTLENFPDVFYSAGLTSGRGKEKLRKHINKKIKETEEKFKYGE